MIKIIKRFLVVIAVLMVIMVLAISAMAVWNSIETKNDLEIIANDTVSEDAKWEQLHKDVITNKDSKVSIISGDHYLHQSNLQGLVDKIASWDVRH